MTSPKAKAQKSVPFSNSMRIRICRRCAASGFFIFSPYGHIYSSKNEVMELLEKEVRSLGIIKKGVCGTCIWEVNDEMTLIIRPQNEKSGVAAPTRYSTWPWWPYRRVKVYELYVRGAG